MIRRIVVRTAVVAAFAALASLGSPRPLIGQDSLRHSGGAAVVRVTGEVDHPLTLSVAGLDSLPRRTVRAAEHGQPEAAYQGVALHDVLERAGVSFGTALRGPALATYVLCSAADGYRVVFALAELDSAFSDRTIILADRKDGQPLDAHSGPFRIVVPGDARPARWIRQVTEVAVVRAAERPTTPR